MLESHIIRFSFRQAGFSTPTVGHFMVAAESALDAVRSIREAYKQFDVAVEYVARGPLGPAW